MLPHARDVWSCGGLTAHLQSWMPSVHTSLGHMPLYSNLNMNFLSFFFTLMLRIITVGSISQTLWRHRCDFFHTPINRRLKTFLVICCLQWSKKVELGSRRHMIPNGASDGVLSYDYLPGYRNSRFPLRTPLYIRHAQLAPYSTLIRLSSCLPSWTSRWYSRWNWIRKSLQLNPPPRDLTSLRSSLAQKYVAVAATGKYLWRPCTIPSSHVLQIYNSPVHVRHPPHCIKRSKECLVQETSTRVYPLPTRSLYNPILFDLDRLFEYRQRITSGMQSAWFLLTARLIIDMWRTKYGLAVCGINMGGTYCCAGCVIPWFE